MFRKPRFPLPTIEKVNIEYHLDWLWRRFGISPIQDYSTFLTSSPELNPLRTATGIDISGLLGLVEDRYGFGNSGCELIKWDGYSKVPPDRDIILLDPSQQVNQGALIDRVAGHLSRRYLDSLPPEDFGRADPVLISELLPVYFGFGVFCANLSLRTTHYSHGESHYWHHQKNTSMAARHFGVALSYRTWIRDDANEELSRALRPDARVPYLRALDYLRRTEDSVFNPERQTSLFSIQDIWQLESLLEGATISATAGILQQLLELTKDRSPSMATRDLNFLYRRLPELLRSPDESIRVLACQAADRFGTVESDVLEGLKDLLSDPDSRIRKEATSSIIYLAPPGQLFARDLIILLKDDDPDVVAAAVKGLVFLQQKDEDVVPELLTLIRKGLNLGCGIDLSFLFGALDTVSTKTENHLSDFLQSDQAELRTALDYVRDWRAQAKKVSDDDGSSRTSAS